MLDNTAYYSYQHQANQADKICNDLRELYGTNMSREKMLLKARLDRIITPDEYDLVKRIYR